MYGGAGQYEGGGTGGGSSLFSGGGFMPSQATQTPEAGGFSRSRNTQTLLPLTVKQISEAYNSNDDKSNIVIDGVEANAVTLLGRVVNKIERITDVQFILDDGTGTISVTRWIHDPSETEEMAIIQNGMYVTVGGNLKGFGGRNHILAFSVRPVCDFNYITLHFLECIHVHLENAKPNLSTVPASSEPPTAGKKMIPPKEILDAVLSIFLEPASLIGEVGLDVRDVANRLSRFPPRQIWDAIDHHVDIGHLYSTIDEYHFKSACNG